MIKKLLTNSLILLTAIILVACTKPNENKPEPEDKEKSFELEENVEVYKYVYGNLDENTMPIGGWGDFPAANFGHVYDNPDLISEQNYKLVADTNINTIYGLFVNQGINANDVIRTLEATSANNLNYLVRDPQVNGATEPEDDEVILNAINKYKTYSSYAGNMIVDEPGIASFSDIGLNYQNYLKVVDDNKMFYINMLPDYASKNQLINGATGGPLNDNTMTYERYLQEYFAKINLPYYSFDFYPYTGFGLGNMRGGYFDQLSIIRKYSNLNKVPYWVFIQASTWSPNHLRVPFEVEVDWQVATSLVYGAKGIQYFMVYTSMEVGAESFEGGMFDKYGKINPMYNYVKKNNEHLVAIDHILMNAKHDGIMVFGNTDQAIPEVDLLANYSVLKTITGGDVLVGCYNLNGKPVYYIMNNSFTNESTLNISFNDNVEFNVINHNTSTSKSGNSYELTLEPGRGALIELTGFAK